MKTLKTQGTAAIGAICLLGLCGVRGVAPNLAAQSQKEELNNGWASVDCDKEQAGALQRAIDRATSGPDAFWSAAHVTRTCRFRREKIC